MDQQPPPLRPQEIADMQTAQNVLTGQPQTVKIFGILHLVFAAFGLFGIASAIFVAVAGNPFTKMVPQTPEMAAQAQIQVEMQEKLMPMTIATNVIGVVVTALMITAGILLLRKKKAGLKWSNRYAIASLIAKVIGAALVAIYMIPAMKEMIAAQNLTGSAATVMHASMVGGAIGGSLFAAIYPTLTLILLNRPKTKAWFASLPE